MLPYVATAAPPAATWAGAACCAGAAAAGCAAAGLAACACVGAAGATCWQPPRAKANTAPKTARIFHDFIGCPPSRGERMTDGVPARGDFLSTLGEDLLGVRAT